MRYFDESEVIAVMQQVEFDSTDGTVPTLEQDDALSAYYALYDDLAEVPQAFAAYLDCQQELRG